MTTALIVTLLILVVVPAVTIIYRFGLRGQTIRVPFGFDGQAGPDADRIHDELAFLALQRRDSA